MKNGKKLGLVLTLVLIATASIALGVVVTHLSTATTANQEFFQAFGFQPPDGPHKQEWAALQAPVISGDLREIEKELDVAHSDYAEFRDYSIKKNPDFPDDDPTLLTKREIYQALDEKFDYACWSAHYLKIPAEFSAACKDHFK